MLHQNHDHSFWRFSTHLDCLIFIGFLASLDQITYRGH